MSLHAVNILGINITNSPKKNILEEIQKYLGNRSKTDRKSLQIVTPNPEQIVYSRHDNHFKELMNRADIAIPDGIGLVWAAPREISQTIAGIDFMEELVAMAAKERVPVALIGGKEKIAVKALECLRQIHSELIGVGLDAPEFDFGSAGLSMQGNMDEYFKKLAETLKKQKIGMVFVGLGAPKQEYFIERLTMSLRVRSDGEAISQDKRLPRHFVPRNDNRMIFMSVGGSFDEISGTIPRAPQWVKRAGIKWLWRLVLEPWRMKRQLSLITFVWLVLTNRSILK